VPIWPVPSASSLPVPPRFLFPVRAERHVQLSATDLASLEEGKKVSKHMMDGLVLWLRYWARSSGVIGGLRVLSALDGEDVKDASTDDVMIVNRAASVLLDRLVFSGGTVVMPVYSGRGWSGVEIRGLDKVVPSVVQAVLDGEAEPVHGAAVVLINTYAGNGGAEVDFEVVNGLFRSLTAAICQTRLRSKDCIGMRTRVNGWLKTLLPVRRVGNPAGEIADTADNLLAYFSLLHSAEPAAAACLLSADDGPQWRKARSPRRLRGLIRRIVEAHRPGGKVWHEQEPADELLNGCDLSEDEASDGGDFMKDVTDDEDAGSGDSARDGGGNGGGCSDGGGSGGSIPGRAGYRGAHSARDGGGDGGGGSDGGGGGGSIPGRAGDRGARASEDADRADGRARDKEDEVES